MFAGSYSPTKEQVITETREDYLERRITADRAEWMLVRYAVEGSASGARALVKSWGQPSFPNVPQGLAG